MMITGVQRCQSSCASNDLKPIEVLRQSCAKLLISSLSYLSLGMDSMRSESYIDFTGCQVMPKSCGRAQAVLQECLPAGL